MESRFNSLLLFLFPLFGMFIFSFSEFENNYILVKLEIKYDEVKIDKIDDFENNQWEFRIFKIENDDSIKEIGNTFIYIN